MIASHYVIDVVDSSCSESDFGEISGPHSSVGILRLILRLIRGVNMVMNISMIMPWRTYLFHPTPDNRTVCNDDVRGGL